jgi:hypothetical protein
VSGLGEDAVGHGGTFWNASPGSSAGSRRSLVIGELLRVHQKALMALPLLQTQICRVPREIACVACAHSAHPVCACGTSPTGATLDLGAC